MKRTLLTKHPMRTLSRRGGRGGTRGGATDGRRDDTHGDGSDGCMRGSARRGRGGASGNPRGGSATQTRSRRRHRVSARTRFIIWSTIVAVTIILIILAPNFAPNDPYAVDLNNVKAAPSAEYPMGTDYLGRCIWSRLLYGAANSVLSAFVVVAITFVIGMAIGISCGYIGGRFDTIVMRFVDAVQAFPSLIFAIAVSAMMSGGMTNCIIALSAVGWTSYARLARSKAITVKGKAYLEAAKVSGASGLALFFKVLLPNCLTPLVVEASMHVGGTILSFAGLSFLGLGTQPPFPEWGTMLSDGRATLQQAPWTVFFPGAAIVIVVMIMSMFGDSVNDILNPRSAEQEQ